MDIVVQSQNRLVWQGNQSLLTFSGKAGPRAWLYLHKNASWQTCPMPDQHWNYEHKTWTLNTNAQSSLIYLTPKMLTTKMVQIEYPTWQICYCSAYRHQPPHQFSPSFPARICARFINKNMQSENKEGTVIWNMPSWVMGPQDILSQSHEPYMPCA